MRFIPYLAIDDFLTLSGSAFTSTVKLSLKVHKAENDVFSLSDIGESGKKWEKITEQHQRQSCFPYFI